MHCNRTFLAFAAALVTAGAHAAPLASDDFDANALKLNGVPVGWTVTGGTVDIIGTSFSGTAFNLVPGHGAYIDLDGSSGDAGLLSRTFTLNAGVEYTATFDLAGSHRGSTETGMDTDCSLAEINPLILEGNGNIKALDAKFNFDSNALFRHPEIVAYRDLDEEDPAEIEASKFDLAYIQLDGNIGCLVNGAGLAMATMSAMLALAD